MLASAEIEICPTLVQQRELTTGRADERVPSGTRDRTTPNPARTLSLGTVSAP